MLYRRCGSEHHHHHLVCRDCGTTAEVEGPEIEQWATHIAMANGFGGTTHTIEITAMHAECMAQHLAWGSEAE
jgi:Fur family ferric uptake transcriptional regulator